jgi:dihydropteroate synthase-like protein
MTTLACVTGKLAEPALRKQITALQADDIHIEVVVLPITVAALMTTDWIARHLHIPPNCDRIIIPGLCSGDEQVIAKTVGVPTEKGPPDLRDLPRFLGRPTQAEPYGAYDALIFAEIVDAPGLTPDQLIQRADYYRRSGADVIDQGAVPGRPWPEAADAIRLLKAAGHRVSLDSMNLPDLDAGLTAGADFLLSAHAGQYRWALESPVPVVIVPEGETGLDGMAEVAARLQARGVPFILDPILQPINFGLAASLHRCFDCRRRFPTAPMMLGAHHLTELLEADTIGVNAVVMGFAQELGIHHILTTEVAGWARGAVRELDAARRLMAYSQRQGLLPKHIDDGLLALKDPPFTPYTEAELHEIAAKVRDRNYRIFVDGTQINIFNAHTFLTGTDPRELYAKLDIKDPDHAFYLGRELDKAELALRLGKRYIQDQPLRWGRGAP